MEKKWIVIGGGIFLLIVIVIIVLLTNKKSDDNDGGSIPPPPLPPPGWDDEDATNTYKSYSPKYRFSQSIGTSFQGETREKCEEDCNNDSTCLAYQVYEYPTDQPHNECKLYNSNIYSQIPDSISIQTGSEVDSNSSVYVKSEYKDLIEEV